MQPGGYQREPGHMTTMGQEATRPAKLSTMHELGRHDDVIILPLTEQALYQHQLRTMREQVQLLRERLLVLEAAREK